MRPNAPVLFCLVLASAPTAAGLSASLPADGLAACARPVDAAAPAAAACAAAAPRKPVPRSGGPAVATAGPVNAIPEPGSAGLFGLGLVALGAAALRRRRRRGPDAAG